MLIQNRIQDHKLPSYPAKILDFKNSFKCNFSVLRPPPPKYSKKRLSGVVWAHFWGKGGFFHSKTEKSCSSFIKIFENSKCLKVAGLNLMFSSEILAKNFFQFSVEILFVQPEPDQKEKTEPRPHFSARTKIQYTPRSHKVVSLYAYNFQKNTLEKMKHNVVHSLVMVLRTVK